MSVGCHQSSVWPGSFSITDGPECVTFTGQQWMACLFYVQYWQKQRGTEKKDETKLKTKMAAFITSHLWYSWALLVKKRERHSVRYFSITKSLHCKHTFHHPPHGAALLVQWALPTPKLAFQHNSNCSPTDQERTLQWLLADWPPGAEPLFPWCSCRHGREKEREVEGVRENLIPTPSRQQWLHANWKPNEMKACSLLLSPPTLTRILLRAPGGWQRAKKCEEINSPTLFVSVVKTFRTR